MTNLQFSQRSTSRNECRLCGNPVMRPRFVAKGYQVDHCSVCFFEQVRDRPDDALLFRLYSDLHITHNKFRDSSAAQKENTRRVALVRRYVADGGLVLDAGCATGDFVVEARNHFSMYGVDISQSAVDVARQRVPAPEATRLQAARLEDLGIEWPQFDAVCLWDVIEHVWDPVRVIRQCLALLKPRGYLFLSTPDAGSLAAKAMRSHWAFMIPPYHLGFFSRKSFSLLFSKITPAEPVIWMAKGKWTNLAFFLYKLDQIIRLPPTILEAVAAGAFGRIHLYVPTNDILYVGARKP